MRIDTWINNELVTVDTDEVWLRTFAQWDCLVDTSVAAAIATATQAILEQPGGKITNTTEYGRAFNTARQRQGFRSQAQLDAFYAHYDHVGTCSACKALDSYVLLDDGYQPTGGECPQAKALYHAYLQVQS